MQVKAKWKMVPIEDKLAGAPDLGVHEVRHQLDMSIHLGLACRVLCNPLEPGLCCLCAAGLCGVHSTSSGQGRQGHSICSDMPREVTLSIVCCRRWICDPQSATSAPQVGGTHAGAEAAPLLGGPRALADGEAATGTVNVEVFPIVIVLSSTSNRIHVTIYDCLRLYLSRFR